MQCAILFARFPFAASDGPKWLFCFLGKVHLRDKAMVFIMMRNSRERVPVRSSVYPVAVLALR